MSLILDALNRSRSEQGTVPNLETVHGEPGNVELPRRRWLPWAGLVLALCVIAWLMLDRSRHMPIPTDVVSEPGPVAAKAPPTADVAPRVSPPAAAPTTAPAEPAPPAKTVAPEVDPDVAALYANESEVPVAAKPAPEPASATLEETVSDQNTAEASEAPGNVTEEQALDIEQMILQAADELENAQLEEHSAPFLSDLSQQVKDSVPTILYERHDYSGRPGVSRVVLNGQSLAEGGLTRGVRVEAILADSVVLEFQGTSFRLRALNSWVNL